MRHLRRRIRALGVAAGALIAALLVGTAEVRAQGGPTTTFPDWIRDSTTFENPYLTVFQYFTGDKITQFNIWTGAQGSPHTDQDEFRYFFTVDTNGNRTVVRPWGTRVWSGLVPVPTDPTNGDDRPYTDVLTIHAQDSDSATGFTDFLYPDDGTPSTPGIIVRNIQDSEGTSASYDFPDNGPSASGVHLQVTKKLQLARDLLRIEVIVKNLGSSRRVGARLFLDPYVEQSFNATQSTQVFIPATREAVDVEKDFVGAAVPEVYELYDDETAVQPVFIARAVLRGNGATTPSRLVVANSRALREFAEANAVYDWTLRPGFTLFGEDVGTMIYWDPVTINSGQTHSFVTYAGIGGADQGMSIFYQSIPRGQLQSDGYVGAISSLYAIPLVRGDADATPFDLGAFVYNTSTVPFGDARATITLPVGLEFTPNTDQTETLSLGSVPGLRTANHEASGTWSVTANGILAGLLPVTVAFTNDFGDTARATRVINVPQGRRYRLTDDWQMLTFPFEYLTGANTPSEVFGIPASNFQIVRYDPRTNRYEQVQEIEPGLSYWVRMLGLGPTTVRLADAQPVELNDTRTHTTQLYRGWNQVGNPSPYAVPVRQIQVLTTRGFVKYEDAVRGGYIRPVLYEYSLLLRRYVPLDLDDVVSPGRGVWIYSTSERRMRWPAPSGPQVIITNNATP